MPVRSYKGYLYRAPIPSAPSFDGPPRNRREHYELTEAKVEEMREALVGKPMRVEHLNNTKLTVGEVTRSYITPSRDWAIDLNLNDSYHGAYIQDAIDQGLVHGLSLTHTVKGSTGACIPEEVSFCWNPARPGAWLFDGFSKPRSYNNNKLGEEFYNSPHRVRASTSSIEEEEATEDRIVKASLDDHEKELPALPPLNMASAPLDPIDNAILGAVASTLPSGLRLDIDPRNQTVGGARYTNGTSDVEGIMTHLNNKAIESERKAAEDKQRVNEFMKTAAAVASAPPPPQAAAASSSPPPPQQAVPAEESKGDAPAAGGSPDDMDIIEKALTSKIMSTSEKLVLVNAIKELKKESAAKDVLLQQKENELNKNAEEHKAAREVQTKVMATMISNLTGADAKEMEKQDPNFFERNAGSPYMKHLVQASQSILEKKSEDDMLRQAIAELRQQAKPSPHQQIKQAMSYPNNYQYAAAYTPMQHTVSASAAYSSSSPASPAPAVWDWRAAPAIIGTSANKYGAVGDRTIQASAAAAAPSNIKFGPPVIHSVLGPMYRDPQCSQMLRKPDTVVQASALYAAMSPDELNHPDALLKAEEDNAGWIISRASVDGQPQRVGGELLKRMAIAHDQIGSDDFTYNAQENLPKIFEDVVNNFTVDAQGRKRLNDFKSSNTRVPEYTKNYTMMNTTGMKNYDPRSALLGPAAPPLPRPSSSSSSSSSYSMQ